MTSSRAGPPTIFAVEILQRRGNSIVLSTDEGVREATTAELLAGLRPVFYREGADIAGTHLNDGSMDGGSPSGDG
ncbi:MAG: hypothetical protein ACO3NY_07855 [Poseidonia sp.]